MENGLPKKIILGVGVTESPEIDILEYLVKNLEKSKEKFYVVTPNPELLVISNTNKEYQKILNQARISLCDGVGLLFFSRFLGKPLKSRVTGVDFVEKVCNAVKDKPITVGFLGGGLGVAELTAECLLKKYPGLKVGFVGEEWPQKLEDGKWKMKGSNLKMEDRRLDHALSSTFKNPSSIFYHPSSKIDILFVAFGSPKQEFWIAENLERLPVKVAIGVGGAFDFISGRVPRAPVWIRNIGLEWLYRLIREPWRLKRQIALIKFIWLVLKERFSSII